MLIIWLQYSKSKEFSKAKLQRPDFHQNRDFGRSKIGQTGNFHYLKPDKIKIRAIMEVKNLSECYFQTCKFCQSTGARTLIAQVYLVK